MAMTDSDIEPLQPAAAEDDFTTSGPPAAEAGGVLTIDLAAIEANWRALSRRAMGVAK